MSVALTYFVHGTTCDNENGVSSGWSDAELSPLGVRQAEALREQTADQPFDAVFSSDLKRAMDTAQAAFGGRAPIYPEPRLRECSYGLHNGGPTTLVEPMQEHCITTPFPEGESYEDVKRRMADLLRFVLQNYDGKRVAFVAHKAPQLALDVLLAGKSWEQAFAEDWRKTKAWKPGWGYVVERKLKILSGFMNS